MQGVDPFSGGGGTLGGVQSAPPLADGRAADSEGLDDLSLSSVSSTLASFFLFLAILRYAIVSTLFLVEHDTTARCLVATLGHGRGRIQNTVAGVVLSIYFFLL